MSEIFCYIGAQEAPPIILEGLLKLEKQDYDSAGICSVERTKVHIRRSRGKLANLVRLLAAVPLRGTVGMGHVRTATCGSVSEVNAHPHKAGPIVLVHNGGIDNFRELKGVLLNQDHSFKSETDSEVIAHLIEQKMYEGSDFEEAVHLSIQDLKGTFALCLVSETEPGVMIAVQRGLPLVVGLGDREYFVASDKRLIQDHTDEVVFLEDNEMVVFKDGSATFTTIHAV
jgi:glucosamine--fructose-6-phosphate aminotransferase (isomerizing)